MAEATERPAPVLEARNATKYFEVRGRGHHEVRALEAANLTLYRGRIAALVGESGSGKTTLARLMALAYPLTDGEILLDGVPADPRGQKDRRRYYARVQLIFQDPFSSLNHLKRVRYIIGRALRIHGHASGRAEVEAKVLELLERVNLTPAKDFIDKFPHQLSGGQRQRVVIARALAVEPAVLLGDEPVSMLDVSIRLDILNLLAKLRDDEGLAILYITHDIASARYFADDINVMYAGQLVESGPAEAVSQQPKHPYTRLLLDCSPDPDRSDSGVVDTFDDELGEPPSLIDPPPGCRFHPRCPFARDECRTRLPEATTFEDGSWTRCWLYGEGGQAG
ncbi:ABC transporter ATP-binding protein [Kribbella catacumbae]|uniref:ABC transporter ATP-binding protein n=1 Tax=Kribbella catacumbae TaxID=460086 RepID=UPI0004774CFB|nr:ABC transporter ATP-binding protein [Kribbella catacumbae]